MDHVMIGALVIAAGGIVYAYFGYPLSLLLIRAVRGAKQSVAQEGAEIPRTTLIITASNEEKRIREKLENTLTLDFPRDRLQVLVASDGSTDRTNVIVAEYKDNGIVLCAIPERHGKEYAQNEAIKRADGDVIVFSDVATRIDPTGLRGIVSRFADPEVGCVSSEDRVIDDDGKPCGEGVYVRYEMWLRALESSVNTLVGLSGSFFAARKEVCQDFATDMQSDFRTLLSCRRRGLRGVCDPDAIGYYQDLKDPRREYARKVRTIVRGLTVFFHHLEFLNVARHGLFSYQYFCHKLLRWLVPVFMIIALIANAATLGAHPLLTVMFAGQCVVYLLAVIGILIPATSRVVLVKIPNYFVVANAAILAAWFRFLRGDRLTSWKPSDR